jgi:hypothetical protein
LREENDDADTSRHEQDHKFAQEARDGPSSSSGSGSADIDGGGGDGAGKAAESRAARVELQPTSHETASAGYMHAAQNATQRTDASAANQALEIRPAAAELVSSPSPPARRQHLPSQAATAADSDASGGADVTDQLATATAGRAYGGIAGYPSRTERIRPLPSDYPFVYPDQLQQQAALRASERELALEAELDEQVTIGEAYRKENERLAVVAKDAAVRIKQMDASLVEQRQRLTASRFQLEAQQAEVAARLALLDKDFESRAWLQARIAQVEAEAAAAKTELDAIVVTVQRENTALQAEVEQLRLAAATASGTGSGAVGPDTDAVELQRVRLERDEIRREAAARQQEAAAKAAQHSSAVAHNADLVRQVKEMEKIVRARFPDTAGILIQAGEPASFYFAG